VGFFIMMTPMLIGTMTGFLLLEDKDESMFLFYSVTPLTKGGYLMYKLITPVVLNFILSFILVYITDLIHIGFLQLLIVISISSLQAIIIAILLTSYAENRVEGLAITKGLGFLFFIPLIEHLISSQYTRILMIFPTYWIPKALEFSDDLLKFSLACLIGLLIHLLIIYMLSQKFKKIII